MRNKKILVTIISFALLCMISAVVFAEYYYKKTVKDAEVDLGSITIGDSSYLSYAGTDDDGYTTDRVTDPTEIATSGGSVTCYASEKYGYSGEEQYISLNQLGFNFTFTTSIMVYVRIQIQDAWISQKYYSNSVEPQYTYTSKDTSSNYIVVDDASEDNYANYYTIVATLATSYSANTSYYTLSNGSYYEESLTESSFVASTYYTLTATLATSYDSSKTYYYNSNSPFAVSNENWVYDANSGYLYYTQPIAASDEEHEFTFEMDDKYIRNVEAQVGYREAILVNVAFNVDIIQANRAKTKWGIDMSTYFAN